jgi:hypothetical protein
MTRSESESAASHHLSRSTLSGDERASSLGRARRLLGDEVQVSPGPAISSHAVLILWSGRSDADCPGFVGGCREKGGVRRGEHDAGMAPNFHRMWIVSRRF